MMKKIISIIALFVLLASCSEKREENSVIYRVSQATSDLVLSWRQPDGVVLTDTVVFESVADIWQKSGRFSEGDIVYLSAKYSDSTASVQLEILINGKAYKSIASSYQPGKPVTVSGVVPFGN
ncbi:MAG: hypothetical protein Kow00127_00850 [Bacteroidales bacterium]